MRRLPSLASKSLRMIVTRVGVPTMSSRVAFSTPVTGTVAAWAMVRVSVVSSRGYCDSHGFRSFSVGGGARGQVGIRGQGLWLICTFSVGCIVSWRGALAKAGVCVACMGKAVGSRTGGRAAVFGGAAHRQFFNRVRGAWVTNAVPVCLL